MRESDNNLLDGVPLRYTQLIDSDSLERGEGSLENERLGRQLARMMSCSEVYIFVRSKSDSINSKVRIVEMAQMSSRHIISIDAGLEVDVVDLHGIFS